MGYTQKREQMMDKQRLKYNDQVVDRMLQLYFHQPELEAKEEQKDSPSKQAPEPARSTAMGKPPLKKQQEKPGPAKWQPHMGP